MTMQEALSIMEGVTYKPGWRIGYTQSSDVHLLVTLFAPPWADTVNKGNMIELQFSDTFNVAKMGHRGKLLKAVRRLCHYAECHEADEWLRYDGTMVHDPHA